jgi:hypothetical protein
VLDKIGRGQAGYIAGFRMASPVLDGNNVLRFGARDGT